MYSVTVSDYLFISHSLDHPDFGPARNLHGATLNVLITVFGNRLNEMNVVIDIGILTAFFDQLKTKYHYQNLDELPEFEGELTTIEFLCRHFFQIIHDELQANHAEIDNLDKIKITIEESPNASASYERSI